MLLFNNATLLTFFLFLAFDLSWHYNVAVAADTFSCCDSSEDGKIMEGNIRPNKIKIVNKQAQTGFFM